MVVKVYKTAEEIGRAAASMYAAQVIKKPDSVLGFATGSTPIPTYKSIIELYKEGVVDFSKVTTFNLDEYSGLDGTHDQSYRYFMMQNLFNHINVREDAVNIINGNSGDDEKACSEYEERINKAGGIDLQILGIGNNGHIAFNEPADYFPNGTHTVKLTESTIEANKRFFNSADEVPKYALTMGIGSIMRARSIILIATGSAKAQAIYDSVKGNITPKCPASVLQLHNDVTFLVDEAAAAKL